MEATISTDVESGVRGESQLSKSLEEIGWWLESNPDPSWSREVLETIREGGRKRVRLRDRGEEGGEALDPTPVEEPGVNRSTEDITNETGEAGRNNHQPQCCRRIEANIYVHS